MASDYGLNFGFRRSDESMATREGRFKTPLAGTELLQGSAIELDPAVPGYYKQSAAGADPVSGLRGLLVQEEDHIRSAFDELGSDSFSRGRAKKDQLTVMWAGIGTKVWFRNTDVYSRFGRDHEARQLVDLTGVVVGGSLAWDGAKWINAAAPADAWMTVTLVAADYCEAVLTF